MAKKSSFEDWRKQNYNLNVRVSNKTIDQLRAGKTFSGNVARFKKSGMTAVEREAMNRFYGKARVSAAFGNAVLKNPNTGVSSNSGLAPSVPRYSTPAPSVRSGAARVGDWASSSPSVTYRPPANTTKPATQKKASKSFWSKAGGFIANEFLGMDDYRRSAQYLLKGQYGKSFKSMLAGNFELGTTALSVAAVPFSGGASLGARAALFGAKAAVKTGAKAAAKQGAKVAARQALRQGAKAGLKSGTAKGAAVGGYKAARYAAGAQKFVAGSAIRGAKTAVGKAASKAVPALERTVARSVPSARTVSKATKAAAASTKGMNAAQKSKSAEYAGVRAMNKARTAAKAASAAKAPYRRAVVTGQAANVATRRVVASRQKSRSKSK